MLEVHIKRRSRSYKELDDVAIEISQNIQNNNGIFNPNVPKTYMADFKLYEAGRVVLLVDILLEQKIYRTLTNTCESAQKYGLYKVNTLNKTRGTPANTMSNLFTRTKNKCGIYKTSNGSLALEDYDNIVFTNSYATRILNVIRNREPNPRNYSAQKWDASRTVTGPTETRLCWIDCLDGSGNLAYIRLQLSDSPDRIERIDGPFRQEVRHTIKADKSITEEILQILSPFRENGTMYLRPEEKMKDTLQKLMYNSN